MKANPQEQAIFNEEFLRAVGSYATLDSAKEACIKVIEGNSWARPQNIEKATKMVNSSKSLFALQKGCYDFFLSHQGLKAIR